MPMSIVVDDGYDVNDFASRLALEREYYTYASTDSGVYLYRVDTFIEAKGSQLAVPWIIVIMNVIITITNSMFERKKEVHILSSIGVNPTQIGLLFVAEAALLGIIWGGIGYLLGLSLYYIMGVFGVILDISQKTSSIWSFASIFVSLISVITGAIVALRFSVIITPSMRRRWRMEDEPDGINEPVVVDIPIKLDRSDVEQFVSFFYTELYSRDKHGAKKIPAINYEERYINIEFINKAQTGMPLGSTTINKLVIDQDSSPIIITLESRGEYDMIRETGSLIRQIAMKWSI